MNSQKGIERASKRIGAFERPDSDQTDVPKAYYDKGEKYKTVKDKITKEHKINYSGLIKRTQKKAEEIDKLKLSDVEHNKHIDKLNSKEHEGYKSLKLRTDKKLKDAREKALAEGTGTAGGNLDEAKVVGKYVAYDRNKNTRNFYVRDDGSHVISNQHGAMLHPMNIFGGSDKESRAKSNLIAKTHAKLGHEGIVKQLNKETGLDWEHEEQ